MESRAAYRDSLVLSITHQLLRATGYARARDGLLSNVSHTLDALRAIELSEQGSAPETPSKTELWRRITEKAATDHARANRAAHAAGCVCFSWCTIPSLSAFFAGLPAHVSSRDEPWHRHVSRIYHQLDVALPIDLHAFGFFSFPRAVLPTAPTDGAPTDVALWPAEFDRHCPQSQSPWCGAERCRPWNLAPPVGNATTPAVPRRKSFAPWSYTKEQRWVRSLWNPSHKVLRVPVVQLPLPNDERQPHLHPTSHDAAFKVKFELSRPDLVMLWRSADDSDRLVPFANFSWAEAFRTRTTSAWYRKTGLSEGILYGCWMYPLHAPFSRGTGVFVNVGRTIAFRNRLEAGAFLLPGPRTLAHALALSRPTANATTRTTTPDRRGKLDVARRTSSAGTVNDDTLPTVTAIAAVIGSISTSRYKALHKAADSSERLSSRDAHWAVRANELGYDSIQILTSPDSMPELLITREECVGQHEPIGTCLPIPLRTGDTAMRKCVCSEAADVLNCDATLEQEHTDVSTYSLSRAQEAVNPQRHRREHVVARG